MLVRTDVAERMHEFVAACWKSTWTESLWALTIDYFVGEGITQFCYMHMPPLGAHDTGRVRVMGHGLPESLLESYIKEKQFSFDPIVAQALAQENPFKFSEIGAIRNLSDAEIEFLKQFPRAGLDDGLAMQAFGPGGRNGFFALSDPEPDYEWDPAKQYTLQSACQFAHLRYCRILRNNMPPPAVLSDRERELLYWVAQGKSNSVIADIMGVSPHTVDAYMRRVFLKMGATDRITAAVRGLSTGVIHDY